MKHSPTLSHSLFFTAFLVLALVGLCALCGAFCAPVARADVQYTLVLFDGGVQLDPADVQVVGTTYTVEYTNNMSLTAQLCRKNTGVAVADQQIACEQGNTWTQAGVYNLTVTATDEGQPILFMCTVKVLPARLTVVWDEATLTCQYGQPVAPVYNWYWGSVRLPWDAIQADDPDASFALLATDGRDFTTYLLADGVIDDEGAAGKNRLRLQLTSSNFCLTTPADYTQRAPLNTYVETNYNLTAYKGAIALAKPTSQTVTFDGLGIDPVTQFGAYVEGSVGQDLSAYNVTADVSGDHGTQSNVAKISTVGTYLVTFHFAGKEGYYANYTCATVCTLVISPCPTRLAMTDVHTISVPYDPRRVEDNAKAWLDDYVYRRHGVDYIIQSTVNAESYTAPKSELTFAYCADANGFADPAYDDAWMPDATYMGELFVRVDFEGNTDYMASQAILSMTIVPCDISDTVSFFYKRADVALQYPYAPQDATAYITGYSFNEADPNALAYVNARQNSAEHLTYERQQGTSWVEATPDLPGIYRGHLALSTTYFTADKFSAQFTIRHVVLTNADVTLATLSFAYGEVIDPKATLSVAMIDAYGPIGGTWAYDAGGATPSVGQHDVRVSLVDDPIYVCGEGNVGLTYSGDKAVTVTRRSVTVRIDDYYVAYGNDWIAEDITIEVDGNAILPQDNDAFMEGITVWATLGGKDYSVATRDFVVSTDGYPLHATLSNVGAMANYQLVDAQDNGYLIITPRRLGVKISQPSQIYEGAAPRLTFDVSNPAPYDSVDELAQHIRLVYTDAAGEEATSSLHAGTYTVKAVADDNVAANYTLSFNTVTLNVQSLRLDAGNEAVVVEGRFRVGSTLSIKTVSASAFQSDISSILKGYSASAVYETQDPGSATLLTGSLTVTLPCPVKGKVAVAYLSDNVWTTVPCERVGDRVTFSVNTVPKAYAVCVKKEVNWLLIGLIAGGVVLVGVAIAVALVVRSRKQSAQRVQEAAQSAMAPTAARKVSEEDELDDFIDNFDESTVERELTPAEKIALREKEEKWAQYRIRLQRMRGSDRTMAEALSQLGLDKDANDDAIIERMIAEDEERARKLQEELDREEEERRAAAEAPTMVIVDHSADVLEQQTYVPTQKDDDDIDDIDI